MNEKERASKSFIKGHLTDICKLDGSIDINEIVERIYILRNYFEDVDSLQKAIQGEITGYQRENLNKSELCAVSMKISKYLKEGI